MSSDRLIKEMSDLRRFVDTPKLLTRDWLSALTLSILGVGTTAAFGAGYVHHLTQHSNDDFSTKLKEAYNNRDGFKHFLKQDENKGFLRNLYVTAATLVISSIVSLGYFLNVQKQVRARESAVKLEYVSRVLKERGFEEDVETHTFYKAVPLETDLLQDDMVEKHNQLAEEVLSASADESTEKEAVAQPPSAEKSAETFAYKLTKNSASAQNMHVLRY